MKLNTVFSIRESRMGELLRDFYKHFIDDPIAGNVESVINARIRYFLDKYRDPVDKQFISYIIGRTFGAFHESLPLSAYISDLSRMPKSPTEIHNLKSYQYIQIVNPQNWDERGEVLWYFKCDGMFAICLDKNGALVYPAVWSLVVTVPDNEVSDEMRDIVRTSSYV